MSQSSSPVNPPVEGPVDGRPLPQNPFQDGAGRRPSTPSPFEEVKYSSSESPVSDRQVPASPFEIVEDQTDQEQKEGGFPMQGFSSGPASLTQLETAPIGGNSQVELPPSQPETTPGNMMDPFEEMSLPQDGSGKAGGAEHEEGGVEEDFAVPVSITSGNNPGNKGGATTGRASEEPSSLQVKGGAVEPITDETRQLELRAIFGVDHELSHQEIIQRMRGLPGIVDVAKVGSAEAEAFVTLQNCAAKLGLAKGQSIVVSCSRGVIDFLEYKGTSLAILREDKYFPGVRETLYICARELEKL